MVNRMRKLHGQSYEIESSDRFILVSYETPVAIYDKLTGKAYRTEQHFSTTTSRHISSWTRGEAGYEKERVPQGHIEDYFTAYAQLERPVS